MIIIQCVSCARDAAVCVITVGSQSREDQKPSDYLEHNLKIFKDVIPNVSKYAPNSVLLILSKPGTRFIAIFNVFAISGIVYICHPIMSDFFLINILYIQIVMCRSVLYQGILNTLQFGII